MPPTTIVAFREADGSVPILDWLDNLSDAVRDKCVIRLELLAEQGHDLRRPHADVLRDGIHELRVRHQRVNFRMLYFFHGRRAVVMSHGLTKQQARVPEVEIARALRRMGHFQSNPTHRTYSQVLP